MNLCRSPFSPFDSVLRMATLDSSEAIQPTWLMICVCAPVQSWSAQCGQNSHICRSCGLILLTGERPGFCCGPNGKYANEPHALPPLPEEFNIFLSDPRVSSVSRLLNLIFSFAALETSQEFPRFPAGPPAFVALSGRVYHHVRPDHRNSAVRWMLYDCYLQHLPIPHADANWVDTVPRRWIDSVADALLLINPFARDLQ